MRGWMKPSARVLGIGAIALGTVVSAVRMSESQYTPAVPPANQNYYGGGGGWGGYSSPGTAAGSAMQGMASCMQAAGERNLANSAAAVNMTQAEKQRIQNYGSSVTTYFQMREVNRDARAREAGPQMTEAQLIRMAHADDPKPLSGRQLDPVTGAIAWPGLLQDPAFAAQKTAVDEVFEARARYGAIDYEQTKQLRKATDAMIAMLRKMIRDVDPMDYTQAKAFLSALVFEATKPAA